MTEAQTLTIHDATLAYSDQGQGPLVLNAHGLTTSRAVNARLGLTRNFEPVAERARLISYDARGHGQSSGRPNPDDYTWLALARDLLALADHFSKDAPVSGIGLSMGTGTLLHAAVARPERFERLVLTAPPTAWETRVILGKMYEKLATMVETSDLATLTKVFTTGLRTPIFFDVPEYPPMPDVPRSLLPAVLRGAGRSDLPARESLSTLRMPTLILAWDTDPSHPLSTARALAELIPNAQLHVSTTSADIRTWGERAAAFLHS